MTDPAGTPVLPYAKRPRGQFTRTQQIFASVATGLILANVVLAALPPWWAQLREVCTECGSRRTQRATWCGYRVNVTVATTALNAWIIAREGSHWHTWQYVSESDSTGLRGCGTAPASYGVAVFDPFIPGASNADVSALVAGLRRPAKHEQEAAVQHFADVVFSGPRPAQGG